MPDLHYELDTLPLGDLVLDPELQMRANGVQEDVARDYANAMSAGKPVPPPKVVRAEGDLLLVDGWHRYRAHQILERALILVNVADGSRLDAFLEACGANATHGLRRSPEDKRRAARSLLMRPELCSMSNRDAAAQIGVSRQHIQNMRKRYSVAKGERLTQSRVDLVDKEPSETWVGLANRAGI